VSESPTRSSLPPHAHRPDGRGRREAPPAGRRRGGFKGQHCGCYLAHKSLSRRGSESRQLDRSAGRDAGGKLSQRISGQTHAQRLEGVAEHTLHHGGGSALLGTGHAGQDCTRVAAALLLDLPGCVRAASPRLVAGALAGGGGCAGARHAHAAPSFPRTCVRQTLVARRAISTDRQPVEENVRAVRPGRSVPVRCAEARAG